MKELSFQFVSNSKFDQFYGWSIFSNADCAITPHSARLQRDQEMTVPLLLLARSPARPAHARCGRREAGQGTHGGYPLP